MFRYLTTAKLAILLLSPWFLTAQNETPPPSNEQEFERGYQERITKDQLYGVYIPKNLDDAMLQLDKLVTPESQSKMKVIPEDSVCLYMHARLGQWMILNWGFYEGSRLSNYFRSAGVTYPDDMADLLILAYHKRLNQKPVIIRDLATYFKDKRALEWQEQQKKKQVIIEQHKRKNE